MTCKTVMNTEFELTKWEYKYHKVNYVSLISGLGFLKEKCFH